MSQINTYLTILRMYTKWSQQNFQVFKDRLCRKGMKNIIIRIYQSICKFYTWFVNCVNRPLSKMKDHRCGGKWSDRPISVPIKTALKWTHKKTLKVLSNCHKLVKITFCLHVWNSWSWNLEMNVKQR